jgi:hypothetical protein
MPPPPRKVDYYWRVELIILALQSYAERFSSRSPSYVLQALTHLLTVILPYFDNYKVHGLKPSKPRLRSLHRLARDTLNLFLATYPILTNLPKIPKKLFPTDAFF